MSNVLERSPIESPRGIFSEKGFSRRQALGLAVTTAIGAFSTNHLLQFHEKAHEYDNWLQYVSPGTFRMKYPPGWSHIGPGEYAGIGFSDNQGNGMIVRGWLKGEEKQMMDNVRRALADSDAVEPEPFTKVGDHAAIAFHGRDAKSNLQTSVHMFASDGRRWTITSSYGSGQMEQTRPVFKKMLNSFELGSFQ